MNHCDGTYFVEFSVVGSPMVNESLARQSQGSTPRVNNPSGAARYIIACVRAVRCLVAIASSVFAHWPQWDRERTSHSELYDVCSRLQVYARAYVSLGVSLCLCRRAFSANTTVVVIISSVRFTLSFVLFAFEGCSDETCQTALSNNMSTPSVFLSFRGGCQFIAAILSRGMRMRVTHRK